MTKGGYITLNGTTICLLPQTQTPGVFLFKLSSEDLDRGDVSTILNEEWISISAAKVGSNQYTHPHRFDNS